MIGVLRCLQKKREYVRQVCTTGFLVHRALIEARALATFTIDCKDVDDRKWGVQNFWRGLQEFGIASVPSCPIDIETMYIDTWGGEEQWDI